jgi:hypothetical protein
VSRLIFDSIGIISALLLIGVIVSIAWEKP